jgi:hypothetical protein
LRNNNAQLRAIKPRHSLILLPYKNFKTKKHRKKAPKTTTKLFEDNRQNSAILGRFDNLFNVDFLKLSLMPYMSRYSA